MGLLDFAAKMFLSYKFNPKPLKRHISGLKVKKYNREPGLKVAAAQVEFRLHKSTIEYFEHMRHLMERAAEEGARLIAFPENIHLPLYGLLPGIEKKFSGDGRKDDDGEKMRAALMLLGPYVKGIYFLTFSSLARLYEMYVIGGKHHRP